MEEKELSFTYIYEDVRLKYKITRDEYALCNYVKTWGAHPKNKNPGWCDRTQKQMASFIGITDRGLRKMINRICEMGLVIHHPSKSLFRISVEFFEDVELRRQEQSSSQMRNKVPYDAEQSSSQMRNKVPTHNEYNNYTNNDTNKEYSAEINSAIPEMHNQSKPEKEKSTPGAWTKEVAILFDRVNQEESAAAGIEYVAFNWQANSGMNFKNLELIRKAIIQDLKLGGFTESPENITATFERCFRSSFQYFLDVANGVGGVVSFTPLKVYQKYNDVKSYAQRGKQRKQTKSDIANQQRAEALFSLTADDGQPGLFDF